VPAGAFDDAGRDRPALLEGGRVVHEVDDDLDCEGAVFGFGLDTQDLVDVAVAFALPSRPLG
jgi:hypothetical protein